MPTPRENTPIVNAPVLFRLPHLHRATANTDGAVVVGEHDDRGGLATSTAAIPAIAANPAGSTTGVDSESDTAESMASAAQPKSAAVSGQPEPIATAADESFMNRWGFEIKRSVILLAAIALLWGAWAMGQKSATAPHDSNLAGMPEDDEANDETVDTAVVVVTAAPKPSVDLSDEPRVAQIVEPKRRSSGGSSSGFEPVTEPQPAIDGSDALIAGATPSTAVNTNADTNSDFSQLSLDAPETLSGGEFYGDYDLGEPAQASSQKPPVTTAAADSDELALNQPAPGPTLPTATNFVPSATPEMPGFDPNNVGNDGNAAPQNRPVLSSMPNGIIDWSRYLPGAGGHGAGEPGAIRAVSATTTIGGAAAESKSADTQAIYLDENDPNSPDVGVAPFYR